MQNPNVPSDRAYISASSLRALRGSESRYRRLFETARDGILILDADTAQIDDVNPYLVEMLGYSHEEFLGKKLWDVGTFADTAESKEMFAELQLKGYVRYDDIPLKTKTGAQIPVEFVSNTYDCDGTTVIQCNIRNISIRKKSEARIIELAFFDQLTGLPNRILVLDRLKQAVAASSRSDSYGALLFIDLDNFRTINDALGHNTGDLLLKQVAKRLVQCVQEGDTVARLGGDEFVVVIAGLNGAEAGAAADFETVAANIISALNQPYLLDNGAHYSTASIGVTLFKGGFATTDDLMKQAELAMYKAKAAGRNVLRFFNPTLESAVKKRVALENDLRHAITEQQFQLHYQPQMVDEGRLMGAEAMLRWSHPEHGMVAPLDFIPLAEETRLILPLGRWVLETACAQLAAWATRPGMAHLSLAVNVSAHQFHQADFVDQVLVVLRKTGANPQRLTLELTESLLLDNVMDTTIKMFALKARGVGFSLDDFGTGYSSLSYLKRLPLDQLKIDKSFVHDVLSDQNVASIVKTIIALAQNLGLGVIAEGVETEAQRDFLAASGCHAYQGYLFSGPLALEDFEKFTQPD